MANISPFRAFRYDPQRVNPSQVVTQPYDKIYPKMQEAYYAASPYNLVRIILGKRMESDSPTDNAYTRAAGFFKAWRDEGVLKQDAEPSLYVYWQRFSIPGSPEAGEFERKGFIAAGKIQEYADKVVFRHEQTLAKPKADRLDVLRHTKAHFGQIFMLYSDPAAEIETILNPTTEPDVDVTDEYGVRHRAWKVSDPAVVAAVQQKMADKQIIIADGHHRYETSLSYRNERRAAAGAIVENAENAPYERVMMTFVNMDSPGLLILPTHRVVHSLASFDLAKFLTAVGEYYTVEQLAAGGSLVSATDALREAGKDSTALLAVAPSGTYLLRTKGNTAGLLGNYSAQQQQLDVVQLHKVVLEHVMDLSEESIRNQENIHYYREAAEAAAAVETGKANLAFLMNPCTMQQTRDIAFAGEVLPQKSTDFYPKLLTGLAIYDVE